MILVRQQFSVFKETFPITSPILLVFLHGVFVIQIVLPFVLIFAFVPYTFPSVVDIRGLWVVTPLHKKVCYRFI